MLHLVCTYILGRYNTILHTIAGFKNTTELQSFNLQSKLQPLR